MNLKDFPPPPSLVYTLGLGYLHCLSMSSVVWLAASTPRFFEDVDFNVCFLGLLLRRCMRAMTLLGDGDGNHRINTYSTTRTHR